MLKIKDDVDLKELEKFGFKPKYDEDTGKLNRFIKIFKDEDTCFWIKILAEINNENYRKIEIDYGTWCDFCLELIEQLLNFIFELIQAGLVEKVGD